jgi:L-2-hydroxyglutarate oxidase LhgO
MNSTQQSATDIDVAVIGGGVVGLASALAIALRGRSVVVLERERGVGHGTSTRNSGVIHAGLYYPAGSLKAQLCVEGRDRLYAFCGQYDVPFAKPGKMVIAQNASEVGGLEALLARAIGNGVSDAAIVDAAFIRSREPYAAGVAALWSPSTGIIEPEGFVKALTRLATDAGVHILPASPVVGADPRTDAIELATPSERISARAVVNAAGLYADRVSALIHGERFCIYPCRGEYAELAPAARSRVTGLLYPLPHTAGHSLGVHMTRTTRGSVLIGPTARYQSGRDDYESERLPLEAFLAPAQALMPSLTLADLQPGGTGIRAKLCPPSESFADFLIRGDREQPRLIHAAGIDSPGLTSSLAIGARVAALTDDLCGS